MSGSDALTRDDTVDVAGIFAALKKRWWVVLGVAIISSVSLFFFLSSIDDRYRSMTRILVKDGKNSFTRTTAETNTIAPGNQIDEQAVRSEVEIIQSDSLALKVIEALDDRDLDEFRDELGSDGFLSILTDDSDSSGKIEYEILSIFQERLNVYPIEQSRVIVIEFWSHDPILSQKIVSMLAENYVNFKLQENSNSQENATSWLDPRIKELETALNAKEAAVAEYRASEDLLRVNNENALLATQQLSEISTELSRLKAERSSTQARANSIKSALKAGVSIDVIPEVLESNLIQRLREREVDLESQVSDLSVTLLPGHPRLKSLNSQLDKLRRQIRSSANDVVTSLERDVAATRDAEAELADEIARLKTEASRVDEKLVELRAREREAQTARDLLAEYRSRSLEAKSRAGLAQANVDIISPATFPTESFFPKVLPFTIAGSLALTLLSILSIIASSLLVTASAPPKAQEDKKEEVESSQSNMKNATRELHDVMGLSSRNKKIESEPTASEAVNMKTEQEGDAVASDTGILAVRHAAKALLNRGKARIAVVSPGGPKGSRSAWVLARQLASFGKRVVLIDFAGGGSSTVEMLGNPNRPGFFDALNGSLPLERVIEKDRGSRARCVAGGSVTSGQLAPSPQQVSDAVDAIAQKFDFCVLDCGDVSMDDLNVVADDYTVSLVSTTRADKGDILEVVDDLDMEGFLDVLQINPDQEDVASVTLKAA